MKNSLKKVGILVALFCFSVATAQHGPRKGKGQKDRKKRNPIEMFKKAPNITDAQLSEITRIDNELKAKNEPIHTQMRQLRKAHKKGDKKTLDQKLEKVDEVGALRTALRKNQIIAKDKINSVLTQEQLQWLKTQKKERRGKRKITDKNGEIPHGRKKMKKDFN